MSIDPKKAIIQREPNLGDRINEAVRLSPVGKYFRITERNTSFFQELRAGLVMFLTCCYIIPVNAGILADTGGPCDWQTECSPDRLFLGSACVFDDCQTNPGWCQCVTTFKRNLIASTCIAAFISTLLMGLIANMPLALAPAMGVNAYFTYTVVGFMGTGMISYQYALAAAFIEGWLFIVISISGIRGKLVQLIPKNIMYATACGIGCFIAFIGLQHAEGLGVITYNGATLVTLGGCPPEERAHTYQMKDVDAYWMNWCWSSWRDVVISSYLNTSKDSIAAPYFAALNRTLPVDPVWECSNTIFPSYSAPATSTVPDVYNGLPPRSSNYGCLGKQLQNPALWLGVAGGVIMVVFMARGVKASILWGVIFVTLISWIPTSGNEASYFGEDSFIPGGEVRYQYFLKGAVLPSVEKTAGQIDFKGLLEAKTWVALITFLYLDFLDATSMMYSFSGMIAERVPGFIDKSGAWPRQIWTMCLDGFAIVIGSILGTSPLTVFAESAVGIKEGGRTGITAIVVAIGFGISMFLAPIFASIPPYATGPAIIFVGALMMEHAKHIEWGDIKVAIPAFLTILIMPLTYSVAYGIIAGLMAAIIIWTCCFAWEAVETSIYKRKEMRVVVLENCSHFYQAFGYEEVLVHELPGWTPPPNRWDEANRIAMENLSPRRYDADGNAILTHHKVLPDAFQLPA